MTTSERKLIHALRSDDGATLRYITVHKGPSHRTKFCFRLLTSSLLPAFIRKEKKTCRYSVDTHSRDTWFEFLPKSFFVFSVFPGECRYRSCRLLSNPYSPYYIIECYISSSWNNVVKQPKMEIYWYCYVTVGANRLRIPDSDCPPNTRVGEVAACARRVITFHMSFRDSTLRIFWLFASCCIC
jgi:hypothetical protein